MLPIIAEFGQVVLEIKLVVCTLDSLSTQRILIFCQKCGQNLQSFTVMWLTITKSFSRHLVIVAETGEMGRSDQIMPWSDVWGIQYYVNIIIYIYIIFEVSCIFLLILWSSVCSLLSEKYDTIEMMAIIIIWCKKILFHMFQVVKRISGVRHVTQVSGLNVRPEAFSVVIFP